MIQFIRARGSETAAKYLAKTILDKVRSGQPVIWFLSGGSAIEVAVMVSKDLFQTEADLTVGLVDERYGPPHHTDSNWYQLKTAGFRLKNAVLEPILAGKSALETARKYNQVVGEWLSQPAYKIALMGIGADGHTAGLLPHSKALESEGWVTYYQAADYQRLTLTPKALKRLDEAVVYAMGESKHQALEELEKNHSLAEQPAQILKQIPKVIIFNETKGEVHEDSH